MSFLLAICPVCETEWDYGVELTPSVHPALITASVEHLTYCPGCGCQTAIIPARAEERRLA